MPVCPCLPLFLRLFLRRLLRVLLLEEKPLNLFLAQVKVVFCVPP